MSISALSNAWYLQGPGSSYVVAVTPEGFLTHVHWGARVAPAADMLAARPVVRRSFSPQPADVAGSSFSLDMLPQEFPGPNTGDFRPPAIDLERADGTRAVQLRFLAARVRPGKPPLPGLPAVYVEGESEADTLEIDLGDEPGDILVTLRYTAFAAHDAICRSACVTNRGKSPLVVRRLLSASVDHGEAQGMSWLHLHGAWGRERTACSAPLRPGSQSIASVRGASSHQHNPFLALLAPGAGEEHGEVRAMNLVYSGNFLAAVELDPYATARAQIGLNPERFSWRLAPGESLQSPEAVLVYSAAGLGAMSRTYHRLYRSRLCRGRHRDAARSTLINNWEATYFNFDQPRLLDLARRAKALGVELFVLDDGWFGRRDDDNCSLGDWTVHARKLPEGLRGLGEALSREGLEFGLWFEPEMVSEDSDLFRAHPDWCLHVPGRGRSRGRNQLVLDYSRPEVGEAIYAQIAAVLRSAPIRYVKWDMNRHHTEVASAGRAPERQGETAHRFILGVYDVMEKITREFPEVLFEGCSGGGGRFDPGLLYYMPQIWTSDNSDAISRLAIQHGTSLVYPLTTMAAHISAVPNHQVHRTTPVATRAIAALSGAFGLELDLATLPENELAEIKLWIARHRDVRHLFATGDLYRLINPGERSGQEAAWMVVAPDGSEALVCHVRILTEASAPLQRLRLRGLRPDTEYRDQWSEARGRGDWLMAHGWLLPSEHDFAAQAWWLRAET